MKEEEFRQIENFIMYNPKPLISQDTLITHSLVNHIRDIQQISTYQKKEKLKLLFEKAKNINGNYKKYKTEVKCLYCNNYGIIDFNKDNLISYILYPNKNKNVCQSCHKNIIRKEQKREIAAEKENQERIKTFIDHYLSPDKKWIKDISINNRFSEIYTNYPPESERILNHIKTIGYIKFLATPYWKAISQYKMKKSKWKCQLCSSSDNKLHVHHPNYNILGKEVFFIDELICLCKKCHKKHHNKGK